MATLITFGLAHRSALSLATLCMLYLLAVACLFFTLGHALETRGSNDTFPNPVKPALSLIAMIAILACLHFAM